MDEKQLVMEVCVIFSCPFNATHTFFSFSFYFLHSTHTICLGHLGGGPLGHPKIYINLVGIAVQKIFINQPHAD